jgi:hypothetical protein
MSSWPFIILVKYASRGRAERFLQGLENIYNLCAQPEYIRVLVTADIDDPAMNNKAIKDICEAYKNCKIIYGTSANKIAACNRDLDVLPTEFEGWDIIANFSDDMRFTMHGWDDLIRVDFNSVFPEKLDGYMAYLDPDTHGALSTLFIAGKPWVERFGFIYDPQFDSLFCDNLAEDAAKHLGKYHYTGYSIYQHFNPSYNYADFPPDQMYIEQQKIGWTKDHDTYYRIVAEGIDNYLEKFKTK